MLKAGFEVQTYEDPTVALSRFEPNSFDLVIIDIKMPQMNGYELYREIKKRDSDVKICFLTANENELRKK
jgi:DNA-binding response OmpR family regulator